MIDFYWENRLYGTYVIYASEIHLFVNHFVTNDSRDTQRRMFNQTLAIDLQNVTEFASDIDRYCSNKVPQINTRIFLKLMNEVYTKTGSIKHVLTKLQFNYCLRLSKNYYE